MSANERHETVLECIQEGAEDYLLKPVTKKVVQCIWQHVWRRQQQQQLPALPPAASQVCLLCLESLVCRRNQICAKVDGA